MSITTFSLTVEVEASSDADLDAKVDQINAIGYVSHVSRNDPS